MTRKTLSPATARGVSGPDTPQIGIVSLGCPKALVDSERIITRLRAEGYHLASTYEGADAVIVNTCGFLDSARAESLEAIAEAMHRNGRVIVTGCLGHDEAAIRATAPNVHAITGPHQYEAVITAVHDAVPPPHERFLELVPPAGMRLSPPHYAWLKISEGCHNRCSFCIIPQLRGDLVSRPVDAVLDEAHALVAAGVKEIMVISQDTGAYGLDKNYAPRPWNGRNVETRLLPLLQELSRLGVWIRLHYVYPYPHIDGIMDLMASGGILPYLDIPFQHASPRILKAMRRPAHTEKTLRRIEKWRTQCPELTLRSTFIVGFPGETEEDFEELLAWLNEARLERVGCFKYEPVHGARANELPHSVDEDEKTDRFERLMELHCAISTEKLRARIGTVETVLVDGVEDGIPYGRTKGDAPDIDGVVRLTGKQYANLQAGDMTQATMTHSDDVDFWAS